MYKKYSIAFLTGDRRLEGDDLQAEPFQIFSYAADSFQSFLLFSHNPTFPTSPLPTSNWGLAKQAFSLFQKRNHHRHNLCQRDEGNVHSSHIHIPFYKVFKSLASAF
jgi:hypothetical protein